MSSSSPARLLVSLLMVLLAAGTAVAQGSIEGTVTFWGDPGGGTEIEIGAHSSPTGPPDETVYVSMPGDAYSLPVADGSYYIAALMAPDDNFGMPRPRDLLVWYDANGDGERDMVTVSGGAVTGIDVDLGFVYVDADATGANDGSSWANAFNDVQDGIDLAVSGVEVWVAEGTYVPGSNRIDSFFPKSGVRVCGGFTGVENNRTQRDWNAHPTILSGEIETPTNQDNCYHVVNAFNSNSTAILDGVTITRGYASGGGDYHNGGGVSAQYGGVTITNSIIVDNYAGTFGGGLAANSTGTVFVANSSFLNNQTPWHGGGVHLAANAGTPSTFVNCVFAGNTAYRGGGIAVEGQIFAPGLEPVLVNLSMSGNSVDGEGGAIHTNTTTFSPPGGAPVTIENSIIWGNGALGLTSFGGSDVAVVNYSIVDGGWAGPGTQVLNIDPSFSDADLRINLDSPAIDAGDNYAVPIDVFDVNGDHFTDEQVRLDRDFNDRFVGVPYVPDTGNFHPDDEPIDMGAYEAEDYDLLFYDGFEEGDTGRWDNVVGET